MYAVHWRKDPFAQMQAIINRFPERVTEIRSALQTVSEMLQSNPLTVGESRDRRMRFLVERPLTFWFRVNEQLQKVYILDVGFIQRNA